MPHGIYESTLYENEFQNPQIFHQPVRFSAEHSTLEEATKALVAISKRRVAPRPKIRAVEGSKIESENTFILAI
jgi:hypothetical protein